MTDTAQLAIKPAAVRPFYWSLRRELWENQSLYIAPLVVAAIELLGFAVSAIGLAGRRRLLLSLDDPFRIRHAIEQPYDVAAIMLLLTMFVVAIFYCLDALHGERRDRSILFWKSLPVSDSTTVLAKLTIALVVLPLITFIITIAVQLLIALLTSVLLLAHGMSPASTFTYVPFLQGFIILFYSLIALSLWHAPIFTWLLLVSAWARRATFLWAFIPFFAASIFERITFGTTYVNGLLRDRFVGFAHQAFNLADNPRATLDSLSQLTPGKFVASPGLWLGLLVAAGLTFATIRLRRCRGPI